MNQFACHDFMLEFKRPPSDVHNRRQYNIYIHLKIVATAQQTTLLLVVFQRIKNISLQVLLYCLSTCVAALFVFKYQFLKVVVHNHRHIWLTRKIIHL